MISKRTAVVVLSLALSFIASVVVADSSRDEKSIELLHVSPLMALGSANIDFQIHALPVASDRHEYALLCDAAERCSARFSEHERLEEIDIEGETAPKLWHPKPFTHVGPGEYWLVAAIGPWEGFRVIARTRILVSEPLADAR